MPARWEQCGRGQDGGTPEQAAEQGHGRTEPPIDSVRSFAAKPRPSLLELSVRPSAHACFEVAGSLRGVQGRSEFSEEPKPRQEVRVSSQPAPPPPRKPLFLQTWLFLKKVHKFPDAPTAQGCSTCCTKEVERTHLCPEDLPTARKPTQCPPPPVRAGRGTGLGQQAGAQSSLCLLCPGCLGVTQPPGSVKQGP